MTESYTEWMAKVWKQNHERNLKSLLTPTGQSYMEYCAELRERGRRPLPYECLWEPGSE